MKLLFFLLFTVFSIGAYSQNFELPKLRFDYDEYEQGIDAKTMEIHHSKHHQGYVNKLNKAVEGTSLAQKSLVDLMMYASYRSKAVRNNAGGHYNHTLFWEILTPKTKEHQPGEIENVFLRKINAQFGSIESLRKELNNAAAKRFGSGWAWLVVTPQKELVVSSSPNQDNPIMDVSEVRGIPILGIDVWEHAYYLRYQNKRGDYLSAIWSLLDWGVISDKYNTALNDPILAQIEKESWPELMHFHKVMAQTFHPAEKKDFAPLRARGSEMFAKAILLKTSNIPKPLLKPEITQALNRLEKQCGVLNKAIRKNARDSSLFKKINSVHNTFHEIQGLCHD